MDVRSPFFQNIASVLIGVMFLNPIVSTAAELAVDAAAGSNTSLGSAGNGVPIVNIATANGNGLSHNKFTDYNVGQQGLILNNATDKLQNTQLGGYIFGNSNLNGRAASVILNEVNGGSPSQLKGYTEVAGQSAHVIVANPHGITCDGCGFINTPKTTLTTGKPVVENGRLSRYDVDSGEIAIEGQGLNAGNVDQFELITRSAKLNAELQANKLSIIAGRNEVDAQSLAATAKAADGSAQPQLAIDSSALGGMYAGAIRLVGTEQGVGVKLAGDMAASAGDIHIDASGQLTLARTAASGNIDLKAQSINLNDSVYAGQDARVTAADRITVGTSLAAAGNVSLKGQRIDNHGRLEAGVKADGSGNAASQLDIQGGALTNQGEILARGQLSTDLASIDNRHAQLVAIGNAEIKAGAVDNRGGTLLGQQVLSVAGDSLDNRGGTLASNKALTITASADVRNGDNGLILSKADGLSVQAQNLNNAGGTVQANSGDLQARGTDALDNNGGKILTGAGKVTLGASELRNQHGVIEAQGGDLTATTATFDNSQGSVVANSVEITSSTRLNNDHGHIVATQGDLGIKEGEVLNHAGQLSARKNLNIDADSLDNRGGILGGETIDLALAGLLGNASGLIEAGERLDITTGSLSNAAGKLRALGQSGKSQFTIGGLFNNDSGLVEIGNAQFALSSQGLSNQAGTVRHVGNQGFGLALADAGQAGGSFITNGELSLDVADWSNSSLLQAQKLTLKVGTFTQTATGKLLSVEDIEASGTNWTNDGSIETDGALQLILSGSYQGNGALKSQGDLKLVAASTSLGVDANLRSGGNGTFSLGSSLVNAGQLSAVGNLLLQVASLTNSGTIGSGQTLRIETSTLLNQSGLIFSGSNMALRTNSLTNLYADIYSLGTLSIAKDDIGTHMDLLDNRSGSIESSGDMNLRAAVLNNRKELFTPGKQLTYGNISVVCYDCSGDHHNVDYVASERFETTIEEDSAAARIHSGNNLDIQGGAIANRYSSISANSNIGIVAATLENTGAASGTIERTRRFNTGRVTDGTDERFRANYIFPYNAQPLPKVVPNALYSWSLVSDIETITPAGIGAPAIIQAGGNVLINAAQSITNASVLTNQAPQAGVAQGVDTQVGGGSLPLVVQLNAQLSPDTTQQAVNPLALPGFSLPQGQNGLFHVNTDPSHPYLIETNPLFASLKGFLNSDYLLSRIGVNSEQTQRRLGDGLYEQRLIQQAIVARTGKRFLDGLTSDEAQFKYLMDNAIASKATLQLAPGVALTAQQVAALTHDIVWMQEQEVNGQKVLVPVLYLAQANDRLAPGGALIQGQDVTLIGGSALKNSGTLRASSNLKASANDISNSGLVQASERLELLATNSIRNAQGGIINSKDVSVTAKKGDISNERTISQQSLSGKGYSQITSVVDKAAGIEATNTLSLSAGRDIQNVGGSLKAGSDATLSAGRDVVIASAAAESGSVRKDKRHFWSTTSTTQYGSEVQVGGDLEVKASNDITVIASTVKAGGDIALEAGNDATIASAANESSSEYRYKGNGKKINKEDSTVRQQASVIEAGGDLDITADNNLVVSASQLKAGDEAYLYAGDQLALLSAEDQDYSYYFKSKSSKSGLSSTKKTRMDSSRSTTQVGSLVSADKVIIQADQDIGVSASDVVSTNGTLLKAGRNVLIDGAIETSESSHAESKKKSGVMSSGGIGFTIGSASAKSTQSNYTEQLRGSTIGSVLGNVEIQASKDLTIRGSDVVAGQDIRLSGQNVNILAAQNNNRSEQTYKSKTGGLTLALSGTVGSAVDSTYQTVKQARSEDDGRLSALQGIKAGLTGLQAWQAAQQGGGMNSENAGQFVGISASLGSQKSSSKQVQEQSVSQGSTLSAGNNLSIRATGSEQSQDGDIRIQGSQLKAGNDLLLNAQRDVVLEAAANTQKLDGKSKSSGGAIGASLGVGPQGGGLSVFASVNQGAGKEKGNGTAWSETTLDAGRQVTLVSGRDTTLKGAQVSGEKVVADVGRDLSLQSLQDSDDYKSRQKNLSAGASVAIIGVGGGANFSASQSKIDSKYRSVQEQTGLFAGKGGFEIEVGKHTQLDGAVIASTAEVERNRLSTDTLGWSDIRNKADYQSQQQSVSVSGSNSGSGGFTGNMPNGMLVAYSHGDSSSGTTASAISGGTIDIRGKATQQQDVANLSRDVEHANGSISPIFDKEKEQQRLQQVQLIAEIGNQSMDILRTQGELNADEAARKELAKQGNSNPSAEQVRDSAAYKKIMSEYGTGSDLQRAAQAVTAALQGLVGGDIGSALAGASAPYLAQLIKQQVGDNDTARIMAHAVLGAVVAQAQGNSAAAGAAGAASGEAMAMAISKALYTGVASEQLSEEQKQTVSALATLAAGLAGAAASGDAAGALAGAQGGKNAAENNWLSTQQKADYAQELAEAETFVEKIKVMRKWNVISLNQDLESTKGIAQGVTEGLAGTGVETLNGVATFMRDPVEQWGNLKDLASTDAVRQILGTAYDSFQQELREIDRAIEYGGDQNAKALGYKIGSVLSTVVAALATGGSAKAAGLSKVGITLKAEQAGELAASAGQKIPTYLERIKKTGYNEDVPLVNGPKGTGQTLREVEISSGGKGAWTKELNKPEPNTVYKVDGNKTYQTDNLGRVEKVESNLSLVKNDRNTYQQCVAGKCGVGGDEGGHLIASVFNGPGERLNLLPMNGNLNKGAWKAMENTWASALKEGKSVSVKIEPIYSGPGVRPDRFNVKYSIDGGRPVNVDFKNMPGGGG